MIPPCLTCVYRYKQHIIWLCEHILNKSSNLEHFKNTKKCVPLFLKSELNRNLNCLKQQKSWYLQITFSSITFGEHLHLEEQLLVLGQQAIAFVFN